VLGISPINVNYCTFSNRATSFSLDFCKQIIKNRLNFQLSITINPKDTPELRSMFWLHLFDLIVFALCLPIQIRYLPMESPVCGEKFCFLWVLRHSAE